MIPDPKPQGRHVASPAEWKTLRLLKLEGRSCRVCKERRAATLHHLVSKSLGGDDRENNLVPVCGDGTRGCHGLIEARSPAALDSLRASLTDSEVRYVLEKKGAMFLDRYYPKRGGPALCR